MRKVEEFYSDEENAHLSKQVASVMGLQPYGDSPDAHKIWVLNGDVHIDEDGQFIPPSNSPFIWLSAYTSELPDAPSHDMASLSKPSPLHEAHEVLFDLVAFLQEVHQENFAAALLMLGGQILCCHFQCIFKAAGQVPVVIGFGGVS